jgi:predicted nuclease of predicted toxin-antitoxin system
MKIWIDAQLPPTLANWLNRNFDVEAISLKPAFRRLTQGTG